MADYGELKDQRGDVYVFNTPDGGEMVIEGGEVMMHVFLYTAVYMSMFGGNEDDAGGDDETLSWWGNRDETEASKKYRSRTEFILRGIPANSANLNRVEEGVRIDLQWLLDEKIANGLSVGAQLTAPKRVRIIVVIEAYGEKHSFEFTENWEAWAETHEPESVTEEVAIVKVFTTTGIS